MQGSAATSSALRQILLLAIVLHAANSVRMSYEKIIGGELAEDDEFPYQLSMETTLLGNYFGFCGASAISDTWALGAAHCMFDSGELISADNTYLRSGSLKKERGGYLHPVEKIITHYKYDTERYDCDIAVIKVIKPFTDNPDISYVRLPHQGQPVKVGSKVTVIGWGLVNDMESSKDLKKTELDVLDDKVCANIPHFRQQFQIYKDMICAAAEGTDSAPGDSGGPLVVVGGEGDKHLQIGVVSWGTGTGQMNDPGIYTKVSQYRTWIHGKTGV